MYLSKNINHCRDINTILSNGYTAMIDEMIMNCLISEVYPPFGQIVRRHGYFHFVANAQTNLVETHFAGEMSDEFLTAFQSDAKCAGGKQFCHHAVNFYNVVIGHLVC
jgi:hypothetical protein